MPITAKIQLCQSRPKYNYSKHTQQQQGDVLGHEFMGIVEEVGPEVKKFKPGDRVVCGFPIVCGECEFCKKKHFTACERTNPSKELERAYGHHIAGIFGYSKLLGGYDGGQGLLSPRKQDPCYTCCVACLQRNMCAYLLLTIVC